MKRNFWLFILLILTSSLFSQHVEYANQGKSYLKELTQPSITVREDAPEIIATGNVNYIIGNAPVIVAPNITLSNFTEDIEGLEISFTNNFAGNQDILELTHNFPGIIENYHHSTGVLKLRGSGSSSFWQDVCRHVQYRNNGSTPTQGIRDVTFSIISTAFIPSTGHYYEFIRNHGISWSDSKAIADASSYYGMQGYLATVTDPDENFFISTVLSGVGWIGGSDAEEHNHWKWVCGPEEGTEFWEGLYTGHPTIPGFPVNDMYSNWTYEEPNQYYGNSDPEMWEDYLHMINNPSVGPRGSWNDLSDAESTGNLKPHGFVVEYGGMPGDPELNLYATVTVTVTDIQVIEILPSAGGELEIDETETINFSVEVNGPLSYSWKLDEVEVSTSDYYDFTTDYSSAGTYEVSLHIYNDNGSDLSYYWNITVNDIDQNIVVNEILPSTGGNITIDELESIAFSIDAYDPDGNTLEYIWKLDGTEVSIVDSYNFTTDYTSAGSHVVTLDVTDNFSENSLNYVWDITVNDVDQNIIINEILPAPSSITIDELESIAFYIDAYDPDGNTLEYTWKLDGIEVSATDSYNFTTDYTSAGSYVVTLDVTDNFSDNSLNYTWEVTVNDIDQNIVVNEILPSTGGNITIDELESIAFAIDAYDPDGNTLEYIWKLDGIEVSTTDSYNFTTDYSSAGNYVVTLDVTDNFSESSLNYTWDIIVNDVELNIVINEILPAPGNITINENESIYFSIDAYDPDGNTLNYNWELDGTIVSTTDSYNFTTNYTSAGNYVVTLDVCNNSLYYIWNITVYDVDQGIVVNEILPESGNLFVQGSESIDFSIDAYDPDGNALEYIWKLNGITVSTIDLYKFATNFSSNGAFYLELSISDNFSDSYLQFDWGITVLYGGLNIIVNNIDPAPGNIELFENDYINFSIDAYAYNGDNLTYRWQLNGEIVSITPTYLFETDFTSAGDYVLTLGVEDEQTDTILNLVWNIIVLESDQLIVVDDIQPTPGAVTINENEEINFLIDAYDPDGNTLNYNWELDGTNVSITDSYNFTTDNNSAGTYIVTLDVTDNFSENSLNYTWDITVNDVNSNIYFEAIEPAPGEFSIAQNEAVNFLIIANNPDGEIYYSWLLDGIEVSTANDFIFEGRTYLLGSYNLQLVVSTNALSRETMQFVWGVNVIIPNLLPISNAGEDQYVDSGVRIQLDASGSYDPEGEELTYHWIVPDKIALSNSTIVNPTFTFLDLAGEVGFNIQLIVNDGDWNSEIDEVYITICEKASADDPIVIPQFTQLHYNYPNPFNPITTIKFDVQNNETAILTIFNVKGQIVENINFTSGSHNFEWDAHNKSSGVYYYQLKSSSYTNTKKMILLK